MKILFIILLMLLYPTSSDGFELKNGDLIFQESCADGVGSAIKEVTTSADNNQFTHVGIVYIVNDSMYVIEAAHPKVRKTLLHDYLFPADKVCIPKSVVGRLKDKYRHCIPLALEEALLLVGLEYDYGYILNNDKYYCSELVYDIFLKANNGVPVFELNVMTFKAPGSDSISKMWVDYFDKLDIPVPEGGSGINPGAMSRSGVIDIIHATE